MSEGSEHREYADALGAYALGALPDAEAERLRWHLEHCAECRVELDGFRAAVDALPASVERIEPPPELKARLMAIVESEAELLRAAGERADLPAPPEPQRRRRWPATPAWRPTLGLAAACIVAVVVVVVLLSTGGGATRTIQARVSGTLLAAGVRASVQVQGTHAQLIVAGLPAPAADHIDELWIKRGAAAPEPAGTFVVRSGSVQVSRPVQRGDLVMVTVEPGPGSPAPTTAPLIVARV